MNNRSACARCGKPLRSDDLIVGRLGKVYHARCFPERTKRKSKRRSSTES